MLKNTSDWESILDQAMAWGRQPTPHALSQSWPRFMPPYGFTRPQWVNTNGHLIPVVLVWLFPWIPSGGISIFTVVIHLWSLSPNLRVQEQSTKMTSQCQYLAFAWRHKLNCSDVTKASQKSPFLAKMAKWAIDYGFNGFVCSIRA